MLLKKPRQIDCFFILVFLAYVFDIGNLKYALAGFFALFYILIMFVHERYLCVKGEGQSIVLFLAGIAALLLITMLLQMVNGFQSYAVNEAIYFITPLMFIWVYVSNSDSEQMDKMLNLMFCICIVDFLRQTLPNLTLENLKTISFAESYSVFENGCAYYMILFEWLYLYKGQKHKAALALAICLVSFKRLCMVCAVLMFIFSGPIMKKERVQSSCAILVMLIFTLLPVVTCIAMSNDFSAWFEEGFGVSLAELTLSRSQRIVMVMETDQIKYGLGSTTVYLTEVYQKMHDSDITQWNLHNDLVRFYLECGIFGTIAFTYTFFRAVTFQRATFVLMCYVFAESYVNHLFGAGSVTFWIIAYMAIVYAARYTKGISTQANPMNEVTP